MEPLTLGYAMCGSFCTLADSFAQLEAMGGGYELRPIFSDAVWQTDTRFGKAADWRERAETLTRHPVWHRIDEVEPIGPKALLDALIVCPCTGNTLGKIAAGVTDTAVTMAVKSHLRNGRPVILAIASNDGLSGSAPAIGQLLNRRNIYFVPFRQDNPTTKPTSLVADYTRLEETLQAALQGRQIQPILC